MWPYWFIFIVPAVASWIHSRRSPHQTRNRTGFNLPPPWWVVAGLLTALIGYRTEVGGDWFNYIYLLKHLAHVDLPEALAMGDPGYRLIEWFCVQNGWGIYGVNLISAAIFSIGLTVFCRHLPRPWLALTAAVPYMVVVVAMGYTRQGVAIGLAMLGLVALGRQDVRKFAFWVLLAATFHKSAVLLLPIAALAATQKRLWTAFWIALITGGAYLLFLEEAVQHLYVNYIEAEYQSSGALIRLTMNAVPAAILLIWRRHFEMTVAQMRLWTWFARISLAFLAVYFLTPASTAVDRVGLYMLPLQLVVFSYVPEVFGIKTGRNQLFVTGVIFYYGLVLFVWLNYATHAFAWVPYRNWLFIL